MDAAGVTNHFSNAAAAKDATALAAASRTNANAAPTQPLLRNPQCGAERCNDQYGADNRAG